MLKKICIYPVIGSMVGSLGYMLTKDIVNIIKEKKNFKDYRFNWKKLINYGLVVGFLSGLNFTRINNGSNDSNDSNDFNDSNDSNDSSISNNYNYNDDISDNSNDFIKESKEIVEEVANSSNIVESLITENKNMLHDTQDKFKKMIEYSLN